MVYAYRSKIHLAEVALNVRDLARQTAFFTQILGLEILSQSDQEVVLGSGGKALVRKQLSPVMAFTIWPFCCHLARI